jgi:hypothetical protein
MADEKPLPEDVVNSIVAKARQIHDASPTDHAGDHPIASIAIQMWMLEESQRAVAEQQRLATQAASDQRAHDTEMLAQTKYLVYGTFAGVAAAFLGVFAAWHSIPAAQVDKLASEGPPAISDTNLETHTTKSQRRKCTPDERRAIFEDWEKHANDKSWKPKLDCAWPQLQHEEFRNQ